MRRLLDVFAGEGIESLEDILDEETIETLQTLDVFLLGQDGERGLDVLVQEQLQGRLPELVDALGVETGMDAHHNVGLFNLLGHDVPA